MLLCLVERSGASLSVFNFVKEAGTLLIIAGAAGFVKLFEQFLLLGGKIAGDFNGDFDVLIAPTLSLQMLYAFFLQFEDVTGLGAGMNLVADLAVQGRYDDLVTKGSLRKGDGNFAPDIVAFPLEDFVLFDVDVNIQVTGRTAVITAVPQSFLGDGLILIDAGRNNNRNGFGGTDTTGT